MSEEVVPLIESTRQYHPETTLSSGLRSNIYFDIRKILCNPEGEYAIRTGLMQLYRSLELDDIDAIVVPEGAGSLMLLSSMVSALNIKGACIRKRRNHGLPQSWFGYLQFNGKYVLVDDVITTGATLAWTMRGVYELGGKIEHILVVVSRPFERVPELSNIPITALYESNE